MSDKPWETQKTHPYRKLILRFLLISIPFIVVGGLSGFLLYFVGVLVIVGLLVLLAVAGGIRDAPAHKAEIEKWRVIREEGNIKVPE